MYQRYQRDQMFQSMTPEEKNANRARGGGRNNEEQWRENRKK
jgi:hypothetical protein